MIDKNKRLFLVKHQKATDPISGEQLRSDFQVHHAKAHNTKRNREIYPLLIDSVINLVALNVETHMQNPFYGEASDLECEKWERFLQAFADIINTYEVDIEKVIYALKEIINKKKKTDFIKKNFKKM